MLRKLIKHEWLRLWKVPTFLLILLQALAVVAGFTFFQPVFESEMTGLRVLGGLVVASFVIAAVGISFGVYIYLALQFYKSTYSDEGYLTHTLPVSSHQLLISKISIMAVWQIVTILGVLLACIIFASLGLTCQGVTWSKLWLEIEFALKELEEYGFGRNEWINMILTTVTGGIVSILYYGSWIAASMSIGQLGRKYRIATAIGAACLISFVLSSVQNIFAMPSSARIFYIPENIADYMLEGTWVVIVVNAIAAAVLYFISEYILRNKLNLE